jgi:hypothetical protein
MSGSELIFEWIGFAGFALICRFMKDAPVCAAVCSRPSVSECDFVFYISRRCA